MIITREVHSESVSTYEGESVIMGIDPEAMEHIMTILSEQYSHTTLAPIREYTTNGIDAQVAAGWFRPVEITSPTWLNSIFTVRDFGIGMNRDDIVNVYANYGASTKRESNQFNGAMGIGSKSAFAYTNQFTVVGIKDGIRTSIVVARDEEGAGSMTIVDQSPTDEPSGVEINIVVTNTNEFAATIKDFAKTLPKGVVLVDGVDLSEWDTYEKIVGAVRDEEGEVIINGIYHLPTKSYGGHSDKIYMGGVTYPALEPLATSRPRPGHNIIADVALGRVKFSPSRESLKDVPSTRRVHELIKKVYHEHLASYVIKSIKEADHIWLALSAYRNNQFALAPETHPKAMFGKYNIPEVSDELISGQYDKYLTSHRYWEAFDANGGASRVSASSSVYMPHDPRTGLFIKNYTGDSIPSSHKAKIRYWMQNYMPVHPGRGNAKVNEVRIFDKVPKNWMQNPVLKEIDWVDWDDIAAIRLPRATPSGTGGGGGISLGGKRYVYTKNRTSATLQDVASLNTSKMYYLVKRDMLNAIGASQFGSQRRGSREESLDILVHEFLTAMPDDTVIVSLYAKSVDKFLREFPDVKSISTVDQLRKPIYEANLKTVTDNAEAYGTDAALRNNRPALMVVRTACQGRTGRIMDPELRKFAETNLDSSVTAKLPMFDTYYMFDSRESGYAAKAVSIVNRAQEKLDRDIKAVLACYPMLTVVNYSSAQQHGDIVLNYINETYENNKKEEDSE